MPLNKEIKPNQTNRSITITFEQKILRKVLTTPHCPLNYELKIISDVLRQGGFSIKLPIKQKTQISRSENNVTF